MKKLFTFIGLIFLLTEVLGQSGLQVEIPDLSTDPYAGNLISLKETLDYKPYRLQARSNHELPVTYHLRNYYNQNYYMQIEMPADGRDVVLHMQYSDVDAVSAGMLAYSVSKEGFVPKEHTSISEFPGSFRIHANSFQPGEIIIVRLWFSKSMKDKQIQLALTPKEPLPSPKAINVDLYSYTIEELVQDVLISGCVEAMNVSFGDSYGDPTTSIGYFYGDIGNSGFDEGIILCSGNAEDAEGPDNSTGIGTSTVGGVDPDLAALIPGYSTDDAAVLEFDFIPATDHIQFEYIFGSEEFPEYANSSYNDVFGFFLSGPGINGPYTNNAINIALLPNGDPVTIDNLFNNQLYYTGSTSGSGGQGLAYSNDIEYDGASIPLTAEADVQACQTYHIKLAIGDAGDDILDSGVFFQAGSFISGNEYTVQSFNPWYQTTEIYEGCQTYVVYTREDVTELSQAVEINMQVTGSATMGTDYANFSDVFYIPAGQVSDTLIIDTYADGVTEGDESIIFRYEAGCPCTPEIIYDTVYIHDEPVPDINVTNDGPICEGEMATLSFNFASGYDPNLIDWTWEVDGTTAPTTTVFPDQTTTYNVEVSYPCQTLEFSTTVEVYPDPVVDLGADLEVCDYDVPVDISAPAGMSQYLWNTGSTDQVLHTDVADTYSVTCTDTHGCTGSDDIALTIYPSPQPDLGPDIVVCDYNVPVTLDPGTNLSFDYLWTGGTTSPTLNVNTTGTYSVTVTDGMCSAQEEINVSVDAAPSIDLGDDQTWCEDETPVSLTAPAGMPNYSWSTGETTQGIEVDATGTYSVTIGDGNSCSATDEINITVNPVPVPDLGTDQAICDYDTTIMLDAGPGVSFIWNIGEVSQIIEVDSTYTYSVTVTNVHGCTGSDEMELTVDPLPEPELGPDVTICDYNAPVSLDPGCDPAFNYEWSNGATASGMEVDTSGYFSVTVTEGACSAEDDITVTVNPSPDLDLGPDITACETEGPFVLEAPDGLASYEWNTGASSSFLNLDSTGNYSLTVTNDHGCSATDYIFAQIDVMPTTTIYGQSHYCLDDDAFTLETASPGGTWSGTGIVDSESGLFDPSVAGVGTSEVHYSMVNGECTSSSDMLIYVHDIPTISVLNMQNPICYGDEAGGIQVFSPGTLGANYHWTGLNYYGADLLGVGAGSYHLVVSDPHGCQTDTTLTITQPDSISVDLQYGDPTCIGNNDGYIDLEVSGGVEPYRYSCELGSQNIPYFSGLYEGEYNFKILDGNGCEKLLGPIVLVDNPEECIIIPDVFTPNGDDVNDSWLIENIDEHYSFYVIQVFNRWGQLLYTGEPGMEPWDGKLNGKRVPAGTYLYAIKLGNNIERLTGTVTIIR